MSTAEEGGGLIFGRVRYKNIQLEFRGLGLIPSWISISFTMYDLINIRNSFRGILTNVRSELKLFNLHRRYQIKYGIPSLTVLRTEKLTFSVQHC